MLKGRKPTKEEKQYMDDVVQMGCIICKMFEGVYSPAEIHHTDGKTKPEAHFKTLGLCFNHHRAKMDNKDFTSRHDFKARFEERYKPESELISITMAKVGR